MSKDYEPEHDPEFEEWERNTSVDGTPSDEGDGADPLELEVGAPPQPLPLRASAPGRACRKRRRDELTPKEVRSREVEALWERCQMGVVVQGPPQPPRVNAVVEV